MEREGIHEEEYGSGMCPEDYYLIDPNAGNIHESPFLDYAKLLQSLHGCYEFLMMVNSVEIDGSRISYIMSASEQYEKIYQKYKRYLQEHFSEGQILSIYLYEVIQWLRLMRYKIRKDEQLAVVFYTGLLKTLSDVWEMLYGQEKQISDF